jgi:ADP-heptose:LPS heptosyltransferase/2-polyprenyl-3-methyl-5-hydroxy-6-metoxy-1,4-benzoquinol methylase
MASLAIGLYVDEGADRIQASIDSLFLHTSRPFRLVLLGDGPDEGTRRVLAGLSQWQQSVTDEPRGPAACFDRLTHLCEAGDYILLESGALPTPGWLDRILSALERRPHCGIAGPSTNFAPTLQCLLPGLDYAADDPGRIARTAARRFGSQTRTLAPTQSLADFCYVVRRAVVDAIGNAEENSRAGQRWEVAHHDRALRAGFASLWVCGAYVHRAPPTPRRIAREERHQALLPAGPALGDGARRNHLRNGFANSYGIASLRSAVGEPAAAPAVLEAPIAVPPHAAAPPRDAPLASCIMPTCDRRKFIPRALRCFFAQDYPNLELVIVDDGADPIRDLLPDDPRIRYIRLDSKQTVGMKRNLACEKARGEFILHWDDDDWSRYDRVSRQVDGMRRHRAEISGTSTVYYYCESTDTAYRYHYPGAAPIWMAALAYRKRVWEQRPFEPIQIAEDVKFLTGIPANVRLDLRDPGVYVAFIHDGNAAPKKTNGSCWASEPVQTLREVAGDELLLQADPPAALRSDRAPRPAALVTAASGIGDIIRVTPLIRVLHAMGFQVDLLLAPDDPAVTELFRGAPELNRVMLYSDLARNKGTVALPELADTSYEIATFTTWSAPLARWVDARHRHAFARERWLAEGDWTAVKEIARAIGWQGPLPSPFAMASKRDFGLAPGTIALHPGCKPGWSWKKWHGFDALARLLPEVAIVGTEADLDNAQTYFGRCFEWPAHARNFVGELSLADTAALIGQCAALVANDSGLMHLGVALGVPTFGIFGITNPARELIPSDKMTPITKGLACEAACRREAWGRRDCEHHLECLRTLTPEEVVARIDAVLARPQPPAPVPMRAPEEAIRLNYYGGVSDVSGYGEAARIYVHALHAAGVKVSVIDTGARPPQIVDPLIASLIGNDTDADFHLFHGIPPYWARSAYALRNVIAMTVWETDTMPTQWRNPLSHAIDVWLPCSFNVEVFARALGRPTFCLPHALAAPERNDETQALPHDLVLAPNDFVFYGIFEWQDRKNPNGMIEAFLRAFPQECDAVLIIKSNPGALAVATRTLKEIRAVAGSNGRVVLRCQAWSQGQIRALQARGDCYVSLHKGEGWAYPLFEAAGRGTPVIATGQGGPLDYLDAQYHWLVHYTQAAVTQRYHYYHSGMRWAEPDIAHASEGMHWVFENRAAARRRAAQAALRLKSAYSLERVGAAAKARLIDLLRQSNPQRGASMRARHREAYRPIVPIPPDWYDADYFERGIKSNWETSYTWPSFSGVFEAAAAYLIEMLPEAKTFLDIGCAKGFLVKALRERGREAWGFDHSPWALEHAEEAAKEFLRLADTATVEYERPFDVLVAMSVLESLTEEQIRQFLARARAWTCQALFATIPTLASVHGASDEDRDLSHITLRDREWWRQQFLGIGWRQDAIHCEFERACRSHSIPTAMGWSVYVFSPGH